MNEHAHDVVMKSIVYIKLLIIHCFPSIIQSGCMFMFGIFCLEEWIICHTFCTRYVSCSNSYSVGWAYNTMAMYISSTFVSIFQAVAKNMTYPTIHKMFLEHKTKSEMWATNQRSGTTLLLHRPTFFALLVIEFLKIAKLSLFFSIQLFWFVL